MELPIEITQKYRTFISGDVALICGDCLEILPQLVSKSINAIMVDPPYYRVSNEDWDKQWDSVQEYSRWLVLFAPEWRRLLKDNGSLYVFGDDKAIAYVQVELDKHFLLLNHIVWYKINNLPIKATTNLRTYAPMTEHILFYSAQYDPTGWETIKLDMNNFSGLREYFRQYQEALGLNIKQINSALGHRKAEHAFYWNSTQWDLPTPETYAELGTLPINNGFLRRDYEDLRRDYEDLRRDYEDLRRPFNADKNTLDVISGPIVNVNDNTEHPTTKPQWLMRRLIGVSTLGDMSVLDPMMGSGTTGVACVQTGRKFIGIEIEPKYFDIAVKRIQQAQLQIRMEI